MSTITVAGSIAQRPGRPGHAWVFLSYLLGIKRLGHEVLFIDCLDGPTTNATVADAERSAQARWLASAMSEFGFEDRYAGLYAGRGSIGLSRDRVIEEVGRSELLINVNGFLTDETILETAPRRVYLDIDPGFAQMWEAQGLADTLSGHDDFVTVGTNTGREDCRIPTDGRRWITTLPPVAVDLWTAPPNGSAFTSVCTWRGPFGPLEHDGERYGLRVHEFRRFLDLPKRVDAPFEMALDIDPEDERDMAALRNAGWGLLDPGRLSDFDSYRRFIWNSLAEIAIAKEIYVRTRGGWFSDRSATYLASGKPVIAQDTGFGRALPTGKGLLVFTDIDEAVAAAQEVLGDLAAHRQAARELAQEHLDCQVVVGRLLESLGGR